jgi:uncharacterized SAM-binding protein YcdF (DUF218 family)
VQVAASLIEPPALIAWALVCLVALTRRTGTPPVVRRLALAVTAAYWALSSPLGANLMVRALEGNPATPRECRAGAQPELVVALAGGISGPGHDEPALSRLKEASFRRTVAACALARRLPSARLLLSGGAGSSATEAELMRELAIALGVPADAIAIDPASRNTRESAAAVQRLAGARQVVHLVTSALHMRRAAASFEAQGLCVCRHPVDWKQVPVDAGALLPQTTALVKSSDAFHEALGYAWYRLSGALRP